MNVFSFTSRLNIVMGVWVTAKEPSQQLSDWKVSKSLNFLLASFRDTIIDVTQPSTERTLWLSLSHCLGQRGNCLWGKYWVMRACYSQCSVLSVKTKSTLQARPVKKLKVTWVLGLSRSLFHTHPPSPAPPFLTCHPMSVSFCGFSACHLPHSFWGIVSQDFCPL